MALIFLEVFVYQFSILVLLVLFAPVCAALALVWFRVFLRPSPGTVRLGGLRSGSPLVVLVYRMAYPLVRVDFYPN